MPFVIVRNDITNMYVDAIVVAADPGPVIGCGVNAGVHQKAGPKLLEARQKIGAIPVGRAAITPGFDLRAKYVIHTVGPVWTDGSYKEEKLLRSCYERSLKLAKRYRCRSVAFPLISVGNHGFPKPLGLQIALNAISEFLLKNEMQVYLVVFSRDAFRLPEKLVQGVSGFINENYIPEKNFQQYDLESKCADWGAQQGIRRWQAEETVCAMPCAPVTTQTEPKPKKAVSVGFPVKARSKLAGLVAETDAGFSETLLRFIDESGKKDSEIYAKANISRQHFSKIRNNPEYKPTKATAVAFAIALELDLEQTRDLIGRAGYALTNSSKFDVIIMYFIRERNYDLFDINAALFEFDQSLLGAQ